MAGVGERETQREGERERELAQHVHEHLGVYLSACAQWRFFISPCVCPKERHICITALGITFLFCKLE